MKYRGESSDGIDSNHPRWSPLIEGIFSTSFTMAYPTIQFIILIKNEKKMRRNQNNSTHIVKSHIISEVLYIDKMNNNGTFIASTRASQPSCDYCTDCN